ncbi:unnamed protein product [Polarella glacialis]|uniref:Uncharacterized protein n=1 Tax=Polarella glacialis TaxID=89957 RepID=A0A813EC14_POLGL|nr:unnamed protein product [Polarella glacialis]
MRKHHETEVEELQQVFQVSASGDSGLIGEKDLPALLLSMGYHCASPEVMKEAVRAVQFAKHCGNGFQNCYRQVLDYDSEAQQGLAFDDLYLIMAFFREGCGYMRAELDEAQAAFSRHAVSCHVRLNINNNNNNNNSNKNNDNNNVAAERGDARGTPRPRPCIQAEDSDSEEDDEEQDEDRHWSEKPPNETNLR